MKNKQALIKAQQIKPKYKKERYYLDDGLEIDNEKQNNRFEMPFLSLWVVNASDSLVDINVKFNVPHDTGDSLKLVKNQRVLHQEQVLNAYYSAPAQAGKWVDIVYGIDNHINPGNINLEIAGNVDVSTVTIGNITVPLDSTKYLIGHTVQYQYTGERSVIDMDGYALSAPTGKIHKVISVAFQCSHDMTFQAGIDNNSGVFTSIGSSKYLIGGVDNFWDYRTGYWQTEPPWNKNPAIRLTMPAGSYFHGQFLIEIFDE